MSAQEAAPQLSGRIDSSYTWMAEGGQSLGLMSGWTGITAGTKDLKTEIRAGYGNFPAQFLELNRAWVKFRFPGVRFTTGLGRLAWGTGFVLVPGDLLFDAAMDNGAGAELDFGNDELRTHGAWLGDAWVSLGDEAFAEAALLKDSAGARISGAPFGVTLEAAGAWDRVTKTLKAAVSTQFHAGLDWYATVRQDLPTEGTLSPGIFFERTVGGAGAFGFWNVAEGVSLVTRHEVLVRGTDPAGRLKSYHDLSLGFDAGWSLIGRILVDRRSATWSPSAEVRWSPLQSLGLYGVVTLKEPWVFRAGATAKW